MNEKCDAFYKCLFDDSVDSVEENRFPWNPKTMTDLELGVVKASKSEFQDATNEVCLFHSIQ
jgi:hypothetical protein